MLADPWDDSKGGNFVLRFRRVHQTGSQAILSQSADGWRISIDLRETDHNAVTIVGYLQPTLETAKQLADKEILKHGHVCSTDCKEWEEFVWTAGQAETVN
jgi:hypothetical protein